MTNNEKNITIFTDTKNLCKTNKTLIQAIQNSNKNQRVILEQDTVTQTPEHSYQEPATIIVSRKRTLEAASAYKDKLVCVHNFASASNPGGGVEHGSSAQEEAICRCSSLYFNIAEPDVVNKFHNSHRQQLKAGNMTAIYNDDCIYTPGVVVFKTDTSSPETMQQDRWYNVDVITCAAPNLRAVPSNPMNPGSGRKPVKLTDSELLRLHEKRVGRICDIAKAHGEEVLILGAFGCGAFCNPPEVVAQAMKRVVDKYRYDFKVIEFAVYCSDRDTRNFEEFNRVLSD